MVLGIYRAAFATDKSILPFVMMCPRPDTVLRAKDRLFVYCNPVEMNYAMDAALGQPFIPTELDKYAMIEKNVAIRRRSVTFDPKSSPTSAPDKQKGRPILVHRSLDLSAPKPEQTGGNSGKFTSPLMTLLEPTKLPTVNLSTCRSSSGSNGKTSPESVSSMSDEEEMGDNEEEEEQLVGEHVDDVQDFSNAGPSAVTKVSMTNSNSSSSSMLFERRSKQHGGNINHEKTL